MAQKKKFKWYHQIDLQNGKVTPGKWLPSFEMYGLPDLEFKNKRILDIGANDGLYSFYAEEREAKEVVAIDILELTKQEHIQGRQTVDGFLYAHKELKSKVKYIFPYSLYDLNPKNLGTFDIVLSLGVIYHLAHPLLSLEKINGILKKGGILVLEAEISDTFTMFYHKLKYIPDYKEPTPISGSYKVQTAFAYFNARPTKEKIRLIKFLITQKTRAFIWQLVKFALYPKNEIYKLNDDSTFYVHDDKVLQRMIDFSGFEIVKKLPNPLSTRMTYICKKVADVDKVYAQDSIYTNNNKRATNFFKTSK